MKKLLFYIKLYPYFVSRSIQGRMAYKGDFILGLIASMLMQTLGFVFIWAVFREIPEINGWNFDQMMFVYGMSAICLGLNEFLFAGTWKVGGYVQEGELDRLLLRPVGTMFSVMAADVTLHGLGSAIFGVVICIVSICSLHLQLSMMVIVFWVIAIVCGTLVYFAINMLCATLAFWITDTGSAMMLLQNVADFSKYPTAIYQRFLQVVLTFVIPFAFTSYYPAVVVLGMSTQPIYWIGTILAALVLVGLCSAFWKYALKRYQSAGG